jgi:hypothetical protein
MGRRERAQERINRETMRRLDAIHEAIMAIPVGPCETTQERFDRAQEEAEELAKWAVFIEGGAEVRRD